MLTPVEYYTSSLLNDIVVIVVTRIGEKPIEFRLNIDDNMPGMLFGDDLRVKQILNNLLSNAIKYTHTGVIELSVHCTRENQDKVLMEIVVRDTGIGIRPDDLKKLFDEYNQVDTLANRKIEGTGLGLSITKRLANMMEGTIAVESEHGKGSTFRVRIRQGYVNDMEIGKHMAENLRNFRYAEDKRVVTRKIVRLNLSYARVLVVDDMHTNLDVAAGLLRKYRIQVDCLDNGHDAVERIRCGEPVYNAIFMDHMMPGMDGIETAGTIRAIGTEYAWNIPIIALTANAIQGTDKLFFEHGFQAFISKPIDIVELDTVLRKWVRDDTKTNVEISETPAPVIVPDDAPSEDPGMGLNIPGIDVEKGLALYGDDVDIYLSVLRSFGSNAPDVLDSLRKVTEETISDYAVNVHGLKGMCANIGAETLREAALKLEKLAKAGEVQGVLDINDQFIKDVENLIASITARLK